MYDSIDTQIHKEVLLVKVKNTLLKITTIFIFTILIFTSCTLQEVSNYSTDIKLKNNLLVHYIDVGQGDSILIQVNNKNMLIDAGNKDDGEKIVSYLKNQKVKKLDYVVATHPHEDHIGGMSEVIKNFVIDDFYAPKKLLQQKLLKI